MQKQSISTATTNPVRNSEPFRAGDGDLGYQGEDDYNSLTELDEENINWGRLLARIVSILLLVGIIICVSIEYY